MPRITRISGSFVIVLIAYWAYALMVVPWIEPPVTMNSAGVVSSNETQTDEVPDLVTLERRLIQDLFQPGDWEIASEKTKVLKSEKARLLLQEYKNLGRGKVEIKPCTIVFDYDGASEPEEQRHRQSIILQAPEGAILQFDRPLDLKQPRDANLIGGQLIGNVIIHSDWKQPGPADDLRITTSNVRLTKQTISTPDPVQFSWGPHFGSGREMMIKLLPGKPKSGTGASGLNIAGIDTFELQHVDRLHLELPPEGGTDPVFQGSPGTRPIASDLTPVTKPGTPVEVVCRGAFRFNVVGRIATFNDGVRVVRPNPTGDPDQLTCDVLAIKFIERIATNGDAAAEMLAAKKKNSMDLIPERFEAQGNPVVVTAPSENVVARAQRIEYNLMVKSLTLDGREPVFLQQGPNEIQARNLYYQAAADKARMGQVVAQGPGWLHGQSQDKPDQQIDAVWQDELKIQPRDQFQVISLTDGAELKSQNLGQLQAKNIFLWIIENPSAPKNQRLKPHGLRAEENVCFNSEHISGKGFERLEVWFEEAANPAAAGLASASGQGMNGSAPAGGANNAPAQQSPQPMGLLPQTPGASPNRPQRFEVTGRLLRAKVLLGTPDPTLTDLTVEERVELKETQTSQPTDRPVLMRGDSVVVNNAAGTATIVGSQQPAHFEGRGLGLTGTNINVQRGVDSSRLWINGPGRMDVLLDKDLDKRPLANPGTLTIDWQGGMNFDGQTAKFSDSVVASTPGIPSEKEITEFRLNTSEMYVRLLQPLRLSEQKPEQPSGTDQQIEAIQCGHGVTMESRTFDNQRQLVSHDQMKLADLVVNMISGDFNGGPGWLNTVRYGSGAALTDSPLAASPNTPAKPDQLFCLHVIYQGMMTGNMNRHEVKLRDQVWITCGPVDNWDANLTTKDPNRLGPDGAVAHCDELQIVQMLLPNSDRRVLELLMSGNAVVEGMTYKASGNRIAYTEAKDLMTIESDGRMPAELHRQTQVGAAASKLAAQKILYWRKTKDVNVVGPQMVEIQLPDGKKR
jgi:lipopolysaccharide export system protein LptA